MMIPDFRDFQGVTADELYHHGVIGMHWGVRRYQNPDGSLTEKGRKRYNKLVTKAGNLEAKRAKAVYKAGKRYMTVFGEHSVKKNIKKSFRYNRKLTITNKKISELEDLITEGRPLVDEALRRM